MTRARVRGVCNVVIDRVYETQATEQSMMEPFSSYAYTDAQDRVCVVASTQVPFHIRRQVSIALQIPKSRVRIIKPRVGGGFVCQADRLQRGLLRVLRL